MALLPWCSGTMVHQAVIFILSFRAVDFGIFAVVNGDIISTLPFQAVVFGISAVATGDITLILPFRDIGIFVDGFR